MTRLMSRLWEMISGTRLVFSTFEEVGILWRLREESVRTKVLLDQHSFCEARVVAYDIKARMLVLEEFAPGLDVLLQAGKQLRIVVEDSLSTLVIRAVYLEPFLPGDTSRFQFRLPFLAMSLTYHDL